MYKEKHIGEKYDDMVIIERMKNVKDNPRVKVKCTKCGRIKIVYYHPLKRGVGASHQYCGNYIKKNKHFYDKWKGIQVRINNPNSKDYKDYGGRGIKCEWEYFVDFYDDMYESYLKHVEEFSEKETTIDRINVNGNYCKENCRWATPKEQAGNKRTNKWFKATSPDGIEFVSNNQTEFARLHNLNKQKINDCLREVPYHKTHKGWTFVYLE